MINAITFTIGLLAVHALAESTTQTVRITNLENVKGNLYIGWYNESSTFRINDKAIYRAKIVVNNQQQVSVDFLNIPKGRYAIAVFLDENDNYKLDRNILGIPTEKYGFSNNILPALRPATFDEAAFAVTQIPTTIDIRLK